MVDRNLDSDPCPRVMKSHNHYRHINLLPSDSRTKIIHVMRDPRDVLCSMYYHVLQVGALFDFQGTFTEFVQYFLEGRVESGSYWEFNLEFLLNPNKHNILYLTYEELTTEKIGSIRKINRFLGYEDLSEEQVDQIDQETKFEVMKGTQRPLQGKVQGVPGQGYEMLSEEEIQQVDEMTRDKFRSFIDRLPPSYFGKVRENS